jgi:hypothetical protein
MPVRVFSPFECLENCDAMANLVCLPPDTLVVDVTHDLVHSKRVPVMGISIGSFDSDIQVWADITPQDQQSYVDRLTYNYKISDLVYHMGTKWKFRNMLPAPLRYLSLIMEEEDRGSIRVRFYF